MVSTVLFLYLHRADVRSNDVPCPKRADIRSKHGIILSCDVTAGSGNDWLQEVGEKMEGARYGFVEDHGSDAESPQDLVQRRRREVWRWLCEEMAR